MTTLTKAKIVETIHNEVGLPRKQSVEIIETLLEVMKKSMVDGEDIMVSGFGKFCVKVKDQRKGRNPATGNDMMLGKRRVVTFKCSNTLRDKVN